jgi:hypothetical protein
MKLLTYVTHYNFFEHVVSVFGNTARSKGNGEGEKTGYTSIFALFHLPLP